METYTNPQPCLPMVGARTKKQGPRTSLQAVSSDMSRRAGPGQTRARSATTQNRWKAARNPGATALKKSPHPHPSTRMTTSSLQRRDGATAQAHRAQGTQNRPFRDREPAPPWQRHPEPEGDRDRRSFLHATTCGKMNGSHRWRCAA